MGVPRTLQTFADSGSGQREFGLSMGKSQFMTAPEVADMTCRTAENRPIILTVWPELH